MLRASAACEAAGFPSSSLVCEGFIRQAAANSVGLGLPDIPVAFVPGHTGAQSKEELRNKMKRKKAEKAERDKPTKKRGPEPERVKIVGDWEEAMKRALKAPPKKK